MRRNMNLREFIEVLKKFPKDWDILIQPPNSEDTYGIKGVYTVSESNWEMPQYDYAEVVIEAMPWKLNVDQLSGEDTVEMYGDRNWYNTIDIFEQDLGHRNKVDYQLTEDGKVKILSCYDYCLHTKVLDEALDEEMEKEEEYYKKLRQHNRLNDVHDFIHVIKNIHSKDDSEQYLDDEEYDTLLKLCYKVQHILFEEEYK